jgi:predicted enzyme related to lactoylglutathione lyase
MAEVTFSSVMIGSEHPETLGEFYTGVFNRPADMKEGGWYGWWFGGAAGVTIGGHSEVKGAAAEPQRVILNLSTSDVQGEFDRIKATGATVIREPYQLEGMWVATLADPDGNYFQLTTPWEERAT